MGEKEAENLKSLSKQEITVTQNFMSMVNGKEKLLTLIFTDMLEITV